MPVFMIGTQRSGSNLLRLMLNQLPDVAAPHPPHILQRLMPLVARYGDLAEEAAFASLIEDVCRLVELNPVPWDGLTLERAQVARRCRARSLVAVFGAVYELLAEAWGKRDWCCKSLANINYLNDIEDYFDRARYVYLYRDGRDVACSFRKAVVGEKHFYHIAQEWAATQRLALEHRARIGAERFFGVSYEDLTRTPQTTIKQLCQFLGVRFTPAMLEFHQSEEARRAASSSGLWGNVTRPIMANNSRKFLNEASHEDLQVFETVAGDVLEALGYELTTMPRHRPRVFSAAELDRFDEQNRSLKAQVLGQLDAEDLKRRDQQAALLREIAARGGGAAPLPA